jgi:hypothetical protein
MIQESIFRFDKERLFKSKAFKEDNITEAVNEFNESIGHIGKCNGVIIKQDIDSKVELFDLGGYIITYSTLKKLIATGIVTIEPIYNGKMKSIGGK